MDKIGGELLGESLFCLFGSVVNVNPGFFFGTEGQGHFRGEDQVPGAGSSSGVGGATILGSGGSMTLRSSTGSLGRIGEGDSPLHLPSLRASVGGTRHTIQDRLWPSTWFDSGLTNVSLGDNVSHQFPKNSRRKTKKTFFLLDFNLNEVTGGGADIICCGVVGEGSWFCSKLTRDCTVRDHGSKKKMYAMMDMEDGYYINDVRVGRAFGEPCLPLAAALRSPTFTDLLGDGEGKTLETWSTIFRHLSNRAKDAEAGTSLTSMGVKSDDEEDRGLAKFYTAMNAPRGVALDLLNSPKRMKYEGGGLSEDDDSQGGASPPFGASSAVKDARFDHLRTSLALVKGELGS